MTEMNESQKLVPRIKAIEKCVFVVMMAIAFTTRVGGNVVPQEVPKVISLIISVYALVLFLQGKRGSEREPVVKFLFVAYFVPALVIHLYSIIMMMIGKMDPTYFSWNISEYGPILVAISSIFLFGKKSLKYIITSIIIAWVFSVFGAVVDKGVGIFPFAIGQAYFSDYTPVLGVSENYLELHDIVLSVGMLGVYFIYRNKRMKRSDMLLILLFVAIFLLGLKRIAVAGLVCATLCAFLFRKIKVEKLPKYRKIIGVVIALVSIGFVYAIFTNEIYEFAKGINLMGRNYYYDVIKGYGEFSPTFLGTGRNSVSMILTRLHPYLRVGGVHSDILKMFIENGFIMFIAWLWYYLFMLPKLIMKKFNIKTMALYLCLIVYTYIIYLTDNVENYYIFQILFVTIPCCYYLNSKEEKRQKNENTDS